MDHLKLAYDKLNPSNLECGLPGREAQSEELENFLFERLKIRTTTAAKKAKIESGQIPNLKSTHSNKTIFVCGVPGTGKTATVLHVISKLGKKRLKQPNELHPFTQVYVNGQNLTKPEKIYSEILYRLTGVYCSPERAQERLELIFRPRDDMQSPSAVDSSETAGMRTRKSTTKKVEPKTRHGFTILVIDELDLLYNERMRQSVFYNLFDWPTTTDSKLILIPIANAVDLNQRLMRGRIGSRMGWEKLVFESYTSDNLENIIKVRLGTSLLNKTFDKTAIVIATKRIGRTTGDARRILDTCREAINEAIELKSQKVTPAIMDQVGFQNIDAKRRNHIRICPPMQLLFLKSILLQKDKVGEENIETFGVYKQLINLMQGYPPLDKYALGPMGYARMLNELAGIGIIRQEIDKPLMMKKLYIKDSNPLFSDMIRSEPVKI